MKPEQTGARSWLDPRRPAQARPKIRRHPYPRCRGEDSNAAGINGAATNRGLLNSGAGYLFVRWFEPVFLKASNARSDDQFGRYTAFAKKAVAIGGLNEDSSAIGIGGNQGDTSAPNSGAVYVFR